MNLVEYPDAELMMFDLADRLAGELGAALRQNDTASLSVPGGTTPGPVFDVLSGVGLDWDRVTVFLNDERWVPESDDRSNARLVRSRLLTGRAGKARFLPFYTGDAAPDEAVERLAAEIEPHLPISVLLLGMGADMHTASLFPGAEGLATALSSDAPAVVALRQPGTDEPRLSLSGRVLEDAMQIHVLITGREKREAIERAEALSPEEAPISIVLDTATVHWAER